MYVSTFTAKCANCASIFEHASLGNFSYGECIFRTTDGKHQRIANAFNEFPQRVHSLISDYKNASFWFVLSELADQIENTKLSPELFCPFCFSSNIEAWEIALTGKVQLDEVSFLAASRLDDTELINLISKIIASN